MLIPEIGVPGVDVPMILTLFDVPGEDSCSKELKNLNIL